MACLIQSVNLNELVTLLSSAYAMDCQLLASSSKSKEKIIGKEMDQNVLIILSLTYYSFSCHYLMAKKKY